MLNVRITGVCAAACTALGTASLPALGQGPPDYGFEWRTIGAPGNADARPRDFIFLGIDGIGPVGRVNRPYRMTSTEITVSDYFEYVQAYSPYNPGGINESAFYGRYIYNERNDPNDPGWYIEPGAENYPANMGWLHAARYCNWLQNGKRPEQSAFESGAYDMSTFTQLPNGDWVGQERRSPGAQFWIPSLDEWIKGMYYDPNRFGDGQGGYWMYPITSESPPVGGLPGTPGAQTSAGEYEGYFGQMFDVGSYPDTMSPWGLLDGSGGSGEMTETDPASTGRRYSKGSGTGPGDPAVYDRLDYIASGGTSAAGAGLRLASRVPNPSSVTLVMVFGLLRGTRRSRP